MYEMYCWVVTEEDGSEGVIAGIIPFVGPGPVPLQHRKREMAEMFRPLAESHGRLSQRPVRLAHLVEET